MNIKFSQAVDGFLLAKEVAACSPYTLRNYALNLHRFAASLDGDPRLRDVTADHVRAFLHQLQTTLLTPGGVAPRPARLPTANTVRNAHITLASLWSWAIAEGYATEHVARAVSPPRAQQQSIEPFKQDEVKTLLKAIDWGTPWSGRPNLRSGRPPHLIRRDRAILLLLLDTGIRASELCGLTRPDLDLKHGTAQVRGKSRLNAGQGKQRTVQFGGRTRKALWQYVQNRGDGEGALFFTTNGGPIDRRHLTTHLRRLGKRADVRPCNPHRFRHTFAINHIRNDGDIYSLQKLLGHSILDMVKRYLAIAQVDCENGHRRAGPVDHWGL